MTPQLKDLLKGGLENIEQMQLVAGAVCLGPMSGVDHNKFYIIAGVSNDKVCVCSVVINSEINQFILKRSHLLERQLEITPKDYNFLSHTSYVNCAQPLKGLGKAFMDKGFRFVGSLNDSDLRAVQSEIIKSGMLTESEIEFFKLR